MSSYMDIVTLVAEASFVVQFVLLLLIVASLLSWSFIFKQWRELTTAARQTDEFEMVFWSGNNTLSQLHENLRRAGQKRNIGVAALFKDGFDEYLHLQKRGKISAHAVSENVMRTMRVSQAREVERLESHLSFLATVGSTAPYVGLFGTVWGIMDAFLALRNVQQATLSLVAPGIAEALVATGAGLFAAIPAVIAYNRFRDRVDRLIVRFDSFIEEFIVILSRQAAALTDRQNS